jgi:hypothetical protein
MGLWAAAAAESFSNMLVALLQPFSTLLDGSL